MISWRNLFVLLFSVSPTFVLFAQTKPEQDLSQFDEAPKRGVVSVDPDVVDLIVERRAFRLLLAYSSARAFLAYEARLRQRRVEIEQVLTKITVVDRRTWGELRFSAMS